MTNLTVVWPRVGDPCTLPGFEEALKAAAENAEDVDQKGRFPKEAITA